MSLLEQDVQQRARVLLSEAGVLVWRQPTGTILPRAGGAIECAPVGACDLTGVVEPEGWRLELECKALKTKDRASQDSWEARMRAAGAIYLRLRVARGEDLEAAAQRWVREVLAAIAARRAGA